VACCTYVPFCETQVRIKVEIVRATPLLPGASVAACRDAECAEPHALRIDESSVRLSDQPNGVSGWEMLVWRLRIAGTI
jgi:hypothetical protein